MTATDVDQAATTSDVQVRFAFVDADALAGDAAAQAMLMPRRATAQAAGHDLVAANVDAVTIAAGRWGLVPTGIAIALPDGFEAQVRPRSGLALKHGISCLNTPGTIDADYRGEIKVLLINLGDKDFVIERGMRIAQLVVARVPPVAWTQVTDLTDTPRGAGGFGSTGS